MLPDTIVLIEFSPIFSLALIALFAGLSVYFQKIDLPGGIVGSLIAFSMNLGGGFGTMGALLIFFVIGSGASSWHYRRKAYLGLAEANKGKRGYKNALANGGASAVFSMLAYLMPNTQTLWITGAFVAIATATSDTVSSELGNVFGRKFINILGWHKAERGKDGVVSLEGTLCGLAASVLIGLYSYLVLRSWPVAALVSLAGFSGNLLDSLFGATIQEKGWVSNHAVNLMSTSISSASSVLFIQLFWSNS